MLRKYDIFTSGTLSALFVLVSCGISLESATQGGKHCMVHSGHAKNVRHKGLNKARYRGAHVRNLKIRPVKQKKQLFQMVPKMGTLQIAIGQKKAQLRPVKPWEKNCYSKLLRLQKDRYEAKLDFKPFIEKLRVDDSFTLENKTKKLVSIQVTYESKSKAGMFQVDSLSIQPGETMTLTIPDDFFLQFLEVLDKIGKNYLNPKLLSSTDLIVSIENVEDRYFLHQYHDFDFTSRLLSEDQLNDQNISDDERQFRKDFNGSCTYLDYVAQCEGIDLAFIDSQRRLLYKKNNLPRLLAFDPNIIDSTTYRIPLITHKIWVTSDENPRNPSDQYIKWLENSIEHNNTPAAGWKHYFWIESKEKLPELAQLLENHPTIIVRELKELDTCTFVTGDLYKEAIKERKFGKASDILRLELLRLYGGFYLDTDYEVFQSLAPYSKAYTMVVALEPMSTYLCNAFIGSCPEHPVIEKSLAMIKRNLGPDAPQYIASISAGDGFKTIVETGPVLFTIAFALAGGNYQQNYCDIVLPPQMIYPAKSNLYPQKQVVTPNGSIPAEALGAHYWNTAWMDPRFGSEG